MKKATRYNRCIKQHAIHLFMLLLNCIQYVKAKIQCEVLKIH